MDSQTTAKTLSSTENKSTFQDISFSSYLKPKDPTSNSQENDTEISIFDAHKYFCENNDPKDIKRQQTSHDLLSVQRLSSVSSVEGYGRNFRTRSFPSTPTASSEASWNSQSGLLANPPGSIGVSPRNLSSDHSNKRSPAGYKKWFFGRKCCCSGKKSVQIKEVTSEHRRRPVVLINTEKSRKGQSHKENILQILPQRNSITKEVVEIQQNKNLSPKNSFSSIDPPCEHRISASGRTFFDASAVSFTFPILNPSDQLAAKPAQKGIISKPKPKPIINPLKELPSMENPANDPGSPMVRDDDVGSDASSDLFEIESFSTQTTSYPMYRRRDSLDEDPIYNARKLIGSANGIDNNKTKCDGGRSPDEPPTPRVAATECYPPSEVSIYWSVATAEGCDSESVADLSVCTPKVGDGAFLRQAVEDAGGDGGKRKVNGLMLMSCRQEKAVSVGPQPVKCVAEGPPIFPLHVGGRPPRGNKPPLPLPLPLGNSHSAERVSLAFAA